ncbi:hypothetical protein [Lactobacillus sp. ESL0225]|uniref:hypothetical protein n=1 Tax=Lactobacillus sp. ESL0225 TaxID=2069351 RepID=UPI000EFC2327|nr:hypothetical protein [Lactobacillus sp. ESL0225]RMC49207.1 hypothetical protein F5ESL0225_05935 [Lactobacillus sp. ESL0225]
MIITIDDKNIYRNIHLLLYIILLVLIVFMFIFLIGFIIDHNTNYDRNKLSIKIKKRTVANTIGGGQEYYLRYWIWQRKKRKAIIYLLSSMTRDKFCYPNKAWRKAGLVKFPGRRECWINASDLDPNCFNNND